MRVYEQTVDEALKSLGSGREGLSTDEVKSRLEEFGKNKLLEKKKKPLLIKFIEQLTDPMIVILILAAVVSGFFGEVADMLIILFVVLMNAVLGLVQEGKAEAAIEALKQMSDSKCLVRRDKDLITVKSEEIVPGDIVLLNAGDSVPADLRIIESAGLKVEEAALTGESISVSKTHEPIAQREKETPLYERLNIVFMGTSVVYGRGEGVVVSTGMHTEMGKIAGIISDTESAKTPLQNKLADLSKLLSVTVIAICVAVFVLGIINGGEINRGNVFEMFMTSVSLAVAAIPEGLAVVVTLLLSLGVTRMSKRKAIIRKLTAVETLGCAQVICTDKTGTLTQNMMTVTETYGNETLLANATALCNDAVINESGDAVGEATEVALINFAEKNGVHKKELQQVLPRVYELPFDSDRKMMSTVNGTSGAYRQFTKGAPDQILSKCDRIIINGNPELLSDHYREKIMSWNRDMARKALRVIGSAYKDYEKLPDDQTPEGMEKDMIFIGLSGMIDPVRPEAKAAIAACRDAKIKPVMITGDHKDTAYAIASELGIVNSKKDILTGSQLSELPDEEFQHAIENVSVYARVLPEHKVRIVDMWKKKGKVVAMTGDGVNDAPALKSADIGVGMGITGTDVTKNVADMVLADDNFATIISAVSEGRRIYENIRKSVQFLLASNLSEVLAIFTATIMGVRLFAPIHILWINLVTDTMPAVALGMEEAEKDSMQKPPRDPSENIINKSLGINIVYQGVLIAILTLVSFFIGNKLNHATGMTMAFTTLSMCEIFHGFNMRSRTKSIFAISSSNKVLTATAVISVLLTVLVVYTPWLNTVFKLTPLSVNNFVTSVIIAFAIIPVVELVKVFARARG